MATILKNLKVLTRKVHRCDSCLRKFPAYTKMQYQACVFDGDFCTTYMCETCQEIFKLSSENEWSSGEVDNQLDANQTPEELLIQLKKHFR